MCPFIDKQYFFCGNKGHTSKGCRKKARSNQNHVVKQCFNVVIETIPDENSEDDVFSIYQLRNSNPSTPITVFITIANHKLPIDVDTGAPVSLLNWNTFQKLNCKSDISLLLTKSKLKTYSGEIVSPKGQNEIEFLYEGKKIKTTFLITNKQSPNVLGRDILGKLQLNWKEIFNSFVSSEVMSDNLTIDKILSDYKIVFSDELGTLKDFEAEIPVDPHIKPIYIQAQPVSYSLKEKIEHKLDHLVNLGIYQPVASSKWAPPFIPVLKGFSNLR